MTPGPRGWTFLACIATAAFCFGTALGVKVGGIGERTKWERWTYSHVAFETKGDRRQ